MTEVLGYYRSCDRNSVTTLVKLNVVFLIMANQQPQVAVPPQDSDSDMDEEQQQGIPPAFATMLAYLTTQMMGMNANIAQLQASDLAHQQARQDQANVNAQLHAQLQAAQAQPPRSNIKVPTLDTFDGTMSETEPFLTSERSYFLLRPGDYPTLELKVLYASIWFRGTARAWFLPVLKDFQRNVPGNRKPQTNEIFGSYDYFEEEVREGFGNPNEKREAERQLRLLEQKGSAVEYLAKFRQIAMKTAFDDDALMSQFYEGLKEAVKDELSKEDWPPTLREFADKAIKIDTRQYARR